jgi:cation:H+ antiporter
MINSLFIFVIALIMIVKGATLATKYAGRLAESFHLSQYTVGFIVVAIVSILPETFVAVNSALSNMSSFGLGVLFGSNVADLTLVLALVLLVNGRNIKVESKILKNHNTYPFLLIMPLVLGIDGHFSRLDGLALILAGAIFYYLSFKDGIEKTNVPNGREGRNKNFIFLFFSMAILLIGSHFTVTSATSLANFWGVNPILIGMLVVGLGTTMPELFFSLKAVKGKDDSLAIGDILGTVLADATVVVGILALIKPFSFPQIIIYVTGVFMVAASFVLFYFMRSGKNLSKREGVLLFIFWIIFVLTEFIINK